MLASTAEQVRQQQVLCLWLHRCGSCLSCSERVFADVLIVAGDVSTDLDLVRKVLSYLTKLVYSVFFCPGNNELRYFALRCAIPYFDCSL